jgi:hypothetical protein
MTTINLPGTLKVTSMETSRTLQNAYHQCTINTDGYADYTPWTQVAAWMPDYIAEPVFQEKIAAIRAAAPSV